MEEPTLFNCPHCAYAFRPGDPRLAVPPGEKSRILACPGCRTEIRVWAPGAGPSRAGSVGCYIVIAIVIAVIVILVKLS